MSGLEFPLSFPGPCPVSSPRRFPLVACADITEGLMADYGTRLGLQEISAVVLAVLKEHRGVALTTSQDHDLGAECARRLDRLCLTVPEHVDVSLLPSGA